MSALEAAARAMASVLEKRPYGGYDYGYNEAFYGPAPKEGRYVVRCEKTDKIVHQTNDESAHNKAYDLLTNTFYARAAIAAYFREMVVSDEIAEFIRDHHGLGPLTSKRIIKAALRAHADELEKEKP